MASRPFHHAPYARLAAPDLAISHVGAAAADCPRQRLSVRVVNVGEAPSRAGTAVRLFIEEEIVAEGIVELPVPPGDAHILTLELPEVFAEEPLHGEVVVGPPPGQEECDGGNNRFEFTLEACG